METRDGELEAWSETEVMALVREKDRYREKREYMSFNDRRGQEEKDRINFANLTFYQFSLFGILWK